MKIVCGLGNPGDRYAGTRHNVGFMAVEAFAAPHGPSWQRRWGSLAARIAVAGQALLVLKPQTYMNLSGKALRQAAAFFRIGPGNIVVAHDDVDLPLGRVLVKSGGGDAGHKGVHSIVEETGQDGFTRVRIGVGRPGMPGEDVTEWVLTPFRDDERVVLDEAIARAVVGLTEWVRGGVARAQNRVNRKVRPVDISPCPDAQVGAGLKEGRREPTFENQKGVQ